MIGRFYPDSILAAGLGENQDTEDKRLYSYRKGYMKGQPDLMILNYHKDLKGLLKHVKAWLNFCSRPPAKIKLLFFYGHAF